jgi:hypothetical protein
MEVQMKSFSKSFASLFAFILLISGFGCENIEPGTHGDTAIPVVISSSPADGATNVSLASTVQVVFSKEIDQASVNASNFLLEALGLPVNGNITFSADGLTAIFSPALPFEGTTHYLVSVIGGAGIKDLEGNSLAEDFFSSFTTVDATVPPPSVPANLTSVGSLGKIALSWDASSGGNLTGYNVYRSTDAVIYSKLNITQVVSNTYDDAIASPEGDGVFYSYKVTAVGDVESDFSNVTRNIHGTRLDSSYPAGFDSTTDARSPYIAEGTTTVDGGDFNIWAGSKLYVLDNATIDTEQNAQDQRKFRIFGLVRVLASTSAPATFTSHATGGGTPADGHGLVLIISGCESFNPVDGSGTLLQNMNINNVAGGTINNSQHIKVIDCLPKFYNLKISSNKADGNSRIVLDSNAIMENCSIRKMYPFIKTDLRGTSFKMDHNILRNSSYSIYFKSLANSAVDPNQIELNDFDGTKNAMLDSMTGTFTVPLGNNFWNGGTGTPPMPATSKVSSATVEFDFTTALDSAPTGVGPTW